MSETNEERSESKAEEVADPNPEVPKKKYRKINRSGKVILTDRDLDILNFIHDMKFANHLDIYQKFFSDLENGKKAASPEWARKRLRQLEQNGFLIHDYTFHESIRCYLGTKKSYWVLYNTFTSVEPIKALPFIDLNTVHHDRCVMRERFRLEQEEGITEWISDRRLRCGETKRFGLSWKFVPDAVYKDADGHFVALEIEIAKKARRHYREKLTNYADVLRETGLNEERVSQVRFLVANPWAEKYIGRECRLWGEDKFICELRPNLSPQER